MSTEDPVTSFDDPRSRTVDEFCAIESICKSSYIVARRRGHGPEELRLPDSKIIRITKQAHIAWRQKMAELAKTEAAQIENQRRRQQASRAGKTGAESDRHVSRRRMAQGAA